MKTLENPHAETIDAVIRALDSHSEGLVSDEVKRRLAIYGANELPEGRKISSWLILIKQFKSWLVIILMVAAFISFYLGQLVDTWVIVMVVLINAAIGFSQEYKAEKAIASLKSIIVKTAKVLRNGVVLILPTKALVPGDIVILDEGDQIPADGRIIVAQNLRTSEAALTGESLPISKIVEPLAVQTSLADQRNMLWKGTFVVGGHSKMIVTGTADNTAIGSITESLINIKEEKSNFHKKTDLLAKQMAFIAIISAFLIFIAGYFFRGFLLEEILLTSLAALVAAVPEGLPAVISIVLAIGAHRMAQRNALIREFPATETLGSVTSILTDKTGTLTQNSLTVRNVFIFGEEEYLVSGEGWSPIGNFFQAETIVELEKQKTLKKLLKIALVSNNSEIQYDRDSASYELIGDPTEGALLALARKGEFQADQFKNAKLDELPFSSDIKYRATLLKEEEGNHLYLTGAPEKVLELSDSILTADGEKMLNDEIRAVVQAKISEYSNHAMRVIALAYKSQESNKIGKQELNHLILAGIVGMIDPPRPDSKEAVEKCQEAGIRVVMLTGDHVNTAVAIAKATGIIKKEPKTGVIALTEKQLKRLKEDEFDRAINSISVFARLSPKMKLKIASRLQAMGHLIAMTGDGVNDAPAIKQSDVGIAMGIMGTDVARAVSDVVLADDNFASIVNAVEEGRIVFTNAKQSSFFLITTNIAESVTLVLSIFMGFPLPLTATQLLWLNLVTDGVTVMALATEPGHGNVMRKELQLKDKYLLNRDILPLLLINVILMAGLALTTFNFYSDHNLKLARTAVFIIMASTQLFNVFNMRSIQLSVFEIGLFSNRYINWAVAVSILLMVLVTEIPQLANVFHFQAFPLLEFVILFLLSSSVLWFGEFYKFLIKRMKTW